MPLRGLGVMAQPTRGGAPHHFLEGPLRTVLPHCSPHSRFGLTDGWSHSNHFTVFSLFMSVTILGNKAVTGESDTEIHLCPGKKQPF